jgi:hypothetical protein
MTAPHASPHTRVLAAPHRVDRFRLPPHSSVFLSRPPRVKQQESCNLPQISLKHHRCQERQGVALPPTTGNECYDPVRMGKR